VRCVRAGIKGLTDAKYNEFYGNTRRSITERTKITTLGGSGGIVLITQLLT